MARLAKADAAARSRDIATTSASWWCTASASSPRATPWCLSASRSRDAGAGRSRPLRQALDRRSRKSVLRCGKGMSARRWRMEGPVDRSATPHSRRAVDRRNALIRREPLRARHDTHHGSAAWSRSRPADRQDRRTPLSRCAGQRRLRAKSTTQNELPWREETPTQSCTARRRVDSFASDRRRDSILVRATTRMSIGSSLAMLGRFFAAVRPFFQVNSSGKESGAAPSHPRPLSALVGYCVFGAS